MRSQENARPVPIVRPGANSDAHSATSTGFLHPANRAPRRRRRRPRSYRCKCPPCISLHCWDRFEQEGKPISDRTCPYRHLECCFDCEKDDHLVPLDNKCKRASSLRKCKACGKSQHTTRRSRHCLFHDATTDMAQHRPRMLMSKSQFESSADGYYTIKVPFTKLFRNTMNGLPPEAGTRILEELRARTHQGRLPTIQSD